MNINDLLTQASELEKSEEFKQALSSYQSILTRWPNNFRALFSAGRLAFKLNQVETGIAYYKHAIKVDPTKPWPLIHLAWQQARFNLDDAAETATVGISRFPENVQLRNIQKNIQIKLNPEELPRDFNLDAELEAPTYSQDVLVSAINNRKKFLSPEEISVLYGRLAGFFKTDGSKILYIRALLQCKQYEKSLLVLEGIENDSFPEINISKAICHLGLGRIQQATTYLEKYLNGDLSPHAMLQCCALFLDTAPDLPAAINTIKDLNQKHHDLGVANLLTFCQAILPNKRHLLDGKVSDSEFRVSAPGKTKAIVLAFTGFAKRTGALPFSLLDRFLAGHGIASASLIDKQACFFMKGITAISDSFEGTIDGINQQLESLECNKVYTLGTSAGGVAAVVYGHKLKARRALSFSGPTDVRTSFLAQHGDTRGQHMIKALNQRLSEDQLNIRAWLEKQPSSIPIHQYFCEQNQGDLVQAKNIAHLPTVTLFPIERYDVHESILSALGTGELLKALNSIVDDANED